MISEKQLSKVRRKTSLISLELNRQQTEDEEYRERQRQMYEYLEELKIANALYKDRWKALAVTGGPIWNEELSVTQREGLDNLRLNMHMDVGQGTPYRTVDTLSILGIFPNFSANTVMKALRDTKEDPVMFIRELYMIFCDKEPTTKLTKYTLEQKLLLSALVHLELLQLIDALNATIPCKLSAHSMFKSPGRKMKYKKVNPYLLKPMHIPYVKTNMYSPPITPKPPAPLCNSVIARFGIPSTENIYDNTRSQRGKEKSTSVHAAKEDGSILHDLEPFDGYPTNDCDISCGCARWFTGIIRYLIRKREREEIERQEAIRIAKELQRAKMAKLRMKRMKMLQKNKKAPAVDEKAAEAKEAVPEKGKLKVEKSIYPKQTMKYAIGVNEFLKNLLEEIPEDKFYILGLPDIHKLPKLQEWARFRLKGEIPHDEKAVYLDKSRKKWEILATQTLNIRSPQLPFPKQDIFTMTWDSRGKINRIAKELRESYYKKTKRSLIQIGQVWWGTMEAEKFHNKTFRSVYFSYLPAREKDIFLIQY